MKPKTEQKSEPKMEPMEPIEPAKETKQTLVEFRLHSEAPSESHIMERLHHMLTGSTHGPYQKPGYDSVSNRSWQLDSSNDYWARINRVEEPTASPAGDFLVLHCRYDTQFPRLQAIATLAHHEFGCPEFPPYSL